MSKQRDPFDFWYAVNNTEVKLMPRRHLETFGATILNYHLITELMDSVGQVRIRAGRLQASKPQIITPEAYSQTALEGFGEEARRYVDWLKEHETDIRILQYGYRLKQESFSEHTVSDSVEAVTERVKREVEASDDMLSAVVVGVDDPWDVCIVRLFWEMIRKSAGPNIRELQKRHLFDDDGGVPRGVRNDVESAFQAANRNPDRIPELGRKLHALDLFEEYEDRFFALVKAHRKPSS